MYNTILTTALGSTLHKNDLYYEEFLIYNSWIIEDIHDGGWRGGLTALTEDQDSVPSTHIGHLTTTCLSTFRGIQYISLLPMGTYPHTDNTYMHNFKKF